MKIYIGFSVDMDRAYSDFNNHGNLISQLDKDYITNNYYKKNFIEYTNKLIDYFENNNYAKSVTWFVNEADYKITLLHKDIFFKCLKSGEIGLHTHLNSTCFNSDEHHMSSNKNDWEIEGIINPNNNLNKYLNYNNFIYKAGNHIRCDELFDTISENNFSIDCTKVIYDGRWLCNNCNTWNISNKIKSGCKCNSEGFELFNDTNILLGSEPFFIKCNNGNIILEIPEIRHTNILKHIKECEKTNNLCFIKLQIHHWQYDELIPQFDKMINNIKKLGHDIEFIDLRDMQRIYFEKKYMMISNKIIESIKKFIPNDIYYNSLSVIIPKDFLDLSIWLFNNYDKRCKIIELFAGIGQCSLLLHELKFQNIYISDFDKKRCNFYKEIDKNYENINPLVSDFYNINLNDFDICFFGNAINSSLCSNLDIQVTKYQHFIDNNKLLIINEKYGSGVKEFKYLLNNLKNYTILKSFNDYHILKKTKINDDIIPFSKHINTYNKIGFDNIIDNIIIENKYQIIQLIFNKNIKSSAGIYFMLHYILSNIEEKIYKCNLTFDIKIKNINLNSKIKIYTGIKWIIIDKELTNNFQTISFTDEFDFFKKSTYRIGFDNIENNELYFKNISMSIIST